HTEPVQSLWGPYGPYGVHTLPLPPPGLSVSVLVREPGRLPEPQRLARVVVGDVRDPGAVSRAVEGQDAVVIILGTRDDLSTGSLGVTGRIRGIGALGVLVVLVLTGGTGAPPAFLLRPLPEVPPRLQPLTQDHSRMERILSGSGLRCVHVLPPHIAGDKPLTGSYEVRVGAAGGGSRVISAPDLGHFLLSCLRTPQYDGQRVYVCGQYP
ncbi:BLVRB reductase, partial [Brachypteracias leptosomus]|nr:BLVRB reductase [Brachypteracias leptosomus]